MDPIDTYNSPPSVETGALSQTEHVGRETYSSPQPANGRRARNVITRAVPWIPAVALALLATLLMSRLVEFFTYSWSALHFPWQLNYDEGVNINSSWLISQDVNIYRPFTSDRFISATHPPFFYLLNALAMKIWGLNLVSGRLFSFVGTLAVGVILWIWVYAETKIHAAGLLSTAIWLSLGPVYVWGTFYKQDMPALALGLLGGLLVLMGENRRRKGAGQNIDRTPVQPTSQTQYPVFETQTPKLMYWSIVPLSLAFWLKQSSIVFLVAVGLYLLLSHRRLALKWIVLALSTLVIPFAAIDLFTGGGFREHVLAFQYYGYSINYFARNLIVLWTYHAALIMEGLAFAAVSLGRALKSMRAPRLSAIYLLVSIPFTLLIFAIPPANLGDAGGLPVAKYNQFLDILAVLCLALGVSLGIAWRGLARGRARQKLDWAFLAGCVMLLAFAQVGMIYRQPATFWYPPLATSLARRDEYMTKVSELIRKTPGDILSEDNWLLLRNNKLITYDDPIAMAVLAEAGAWDQSGLVQDINRRRFSIVITEFDLTGAEHSTRWSKEALRAVQANYDLLISEPNLGVVYVQR